MNTRSKGSQAEKIALEFLQKKGFFIIGKNFHASNLGEIDIITKKDNEIIFFEVKSVRKHSEYSIYETVSKAKRKRIKKAIRYWINKHELYDAVWRVDFIGIVFENKVKFTIDHIEFLDLD